MTLEIDPERLAALVDRLERAAQVSAQTAAAINRGGGMPESVLRRWGWALGTLLGAAMSFVGSYTAMSTKVAVLETRLLSVERRVEAGEARDVHQEQRMNAHVETMHRALGQP